MPTALVSSVTRSPPMYTLKELSKIPFNTLYAPSADFGSFWIRPEPGYLKLNQQITVPLQRSSPG